MIFCISRISLRSENSFSLDQFAVRAADKVASYFSNAILVQVCKLITAFLSHSSLITM